MITTVPLPSATGWAGQPSVASMVHVDEQPSPSAVFPSSHCSPGPTIPSPHTGICPPVPLVLLLELVSMPPAPVLVVEVALLLVVPPPVEPLVVLVAPVLIPPDSKAHDASTARQAKAK
jgi:hypothetical protein